MMDGTNVYIPIHNKSGAFYYTYKTREEAEKAIKENWLLNYEVEEMKFDGEYLSGDIFPVEQFLKYVSNGYYHSSNGSGKLLNENLTIDGIFNFQNKEEALNHKYVIWFPN